MKGKMGEGEVGWWVGGSLWEKGRCGGKLSIG